ncbi:hypothetical protein EYV94_11935 [Puteibacter caeruleilacunae]|nr:hypothetical protein EYV94_11935 [Puteibacter caeruleilacunae]
MKTLRTLIAVVLVALVGTSVSAQVAKDDAKTINLTANLNTTIALKLDQSDIVFDFTTLEHYKNGLGQKGGEYSSTGSVSSTTNWVLTFVASKDFTHTNQKDKMDLANVGLTAEFQGNPISNYTDNGPLALKKSNETTILGYNGKDMNAGDHDTNRFTIYWEMGTQRNTMKKESIFNQDLKKGSYNTDVKFTAREVL